MTNEEILAKLNHKDGLIKTVEIHKAMEAARKDEVEKILKWVEGYSGSLFNWKQLYQIFKTQTMDKRSLTQSASELIAALENGKELEKDYTLAFPENYKYSNAGDHVEGIRMVTSSSGRLFERYGWGSGLGSDTDVIFEIVKHPERWYIKQ